jgi:hypothetical protein
MTTIKRREYNTNELEEEALDITIATSPAIAGRQLTGNGRHSPQGCRQLRYYVNDTFIHIMSQGQQRDVGIVTVDTKLLLSG